MCPSYPHAVIVPKAVDDETLVKAAAFRMGGRFPVFSFFHRESRVTETDSAGSDGVGGGGEKKCLVWCEGLAWLGTGSQAQQDKMGGWFQVPKDDLNEKSITGPIGKNEFRKPGIQRFWVGFLVLFVKNQI